MIDSYLEEWIDQAARAVGLTGSGVDWFRTGVRHRLAMGALEYGESFRTRPLDELFAEVAQEPLDVAAWASLISSRLHGDPDTHEAQLHLILAAGHGIRAAQEIEAAREALDN